MKKFLLFIAALLATSSAAFADLYVIGSDVNGESWVLARPDAKMIETSVGVYEWTGQTLGSGFKINDGAWDGNYNIGSYGTGIKLDTPYFFYNGGDSADITFEGFDLVTNPKVVLNLNAGTITLTGIATEKEPDDPYAVTFYMIGSNVNGKSWELAQEDAKFTKVSDNIYRWKGEVLGTGFKINDGTWSNSNYNIGSAGDAIAMNTPFYYWASGSSGNIAFDGFTSLKNPEVELNFNNWTITLIGGEPEGIADWYICGINGVYELTDEWKLSQVGNSNVFEREVYLSEPVGELKISDNGWAHQYGTYSPEYDYITYQHSEVYLERVYGEGGDVPYELQTGYWKVRFDLDNLTLSFYRVNDNPGYVEADYYMIGSNVNGRYWEFASPDCAFVSKGNGIYEWRGDILGTGFKINDGSWEDETDDFGSNGNALYLGKAYHYEVGYTSGNIAFDSFTTLTNPVVILNTNDGTITVYGDQSYGEYKWYAMGFNNVWEFVPENELVPMGSGVYSADIEITDVTGEMKISDTGWAHEYGSFEYQEISLNNRTVNVEAVPLLEGNIYYNLPRGYYKVSFNLNSRTVSIQQIENPNGQQNVTFDFTVPEKLGINPNGATEINLSGVTFANGNVTMSIHSDEDAPTPARLYYSNTAGWTFRFYNRTDFTIAVPDGYLLKGISFDGTNIGTSWTYSSGSLSDTMWTPTGDTSSVKFRKVEAGNNPAIATITVYYEIDPNQSGSGGNTDPDDPQNPDNPDNPQDPEGDYVTYDFYHPSTLGMGFVDFGEYDEQVDLTGMQLYNGPVCMSFESSDFATYPPRLFYGAENHEGWSMRFYVNTFVTVDVAKGHKLTGIEFEGDNIDINWSISNGRIDGNTWIPSQPTDKVVFSKTQTGLNPVIRTMKVFYEGENGDQPVSESFYYILNSGDVSGETSWIPLEKNESAANSFTATAPILFDKFYVVKYQDGNATLLGGNPKAGIALNEPYQLVAGDKVEGVEFDNFDLLLNSTINFDASTNSLTLASGFPYVEGTYSASDSDSTLYVISTNVNGFNCTTPDELGLMEKIGNNYRWIGTSLGSEFKIVASDGKEIFYVLGGSDRAVNLGVPYNYYIGKTVNNFHVAEVSVIENPQILIDTTRWEIIVTSTTEINSLMNGDNMEDLYFGINGLQVGKPDKGIYIKVSDGKAEKVMF